MPDFFSYQGVWTLVYHRRQHYRFRVGNHTFRAPSRFSFKMSRFFACFALIVQCVHLYYFVCFACLKFKDASTWVPNCPGLNISRVIFLVLLLGHLAPRGAVGARHDRLPPQLSPLLPVVCHGLCLCGGFAGPLRDVVNLLLFRPTPSSLSFDCSVVLLWLRRPILSRAHTISVFAGLQLPGDLLMGLYALWWFSHMLISYLS